jgi:hypothetical protein
MAEEKVNSVAEIFNILLVCRQIYHEARTAPFSCNTWELWKTEHGKPSCRRGLLRWLDLYGKIDFETRKPIKWLSFRDEIEQARPPADTYELWCALSLVDGLKFMVRSDVGLKASWDDVRRWRDAMERGCHVVEEDLSTKFGLQMLLPKKHGELSTN